jgi:putative transposase
MSLVERFFCSLKEECVWLHNFGSFTEARAAITKWIHWYKAERPHQSLGYRSPRQFRELQPRLVA